MLHAFSLQEWYVRIIAAFPFSILHEEQRLQPNPNFELGLMGRWQNQ